MLQQNKKGQVLFELHKKWCLFLQLVAEKMTKFWVQLKQIFGPSHLVRALGENALRLNSAA
jgi:hypothetical protein